MIAISADGSAESSSPRLRLRWLFLLLLLVLIYGSHAPLLSLCKTQSQIPFSASSCVLLIETSKLFISFVSLLASGSVSTFRISKSMTTASPYAVPALLYAFNNHLVVFMQAYMDPSSFQVLSNLKIASTALLYTSCLGKRLHRRQWFAIGLLISAGVSHSCFSYDLDSKQETSVYITSWGLLLVLVYCFVSGLAAVYTERVLKSQRLPLSMQNLFLYAFGVVVNLMSHLFGGEQKGFFEGYSAVVWVIVAGQVANGLLMSVVMKHGTGITRLFVISSAMLVNAVLSWGILGVQLNGYFLIPVVLIGWAVYLYYT
ncbi:probable UDP-sugar transporter protein SLC35A4 [Danio aesculapii]|uniref:probable UDP-sugar transporter protein SLC35A4 n=1 Tax=Danio aesculapii TaxID=1142201 RepID=UPI0024BF659F|nr:probable UDP-sugar transporter protein SLC35A4 [Danio aesculapii]XP_056327822.1 probable UDP-sugar transporter protein SLC35A4 [Danio aesculapii]